MTSQSDAAPRLRYSVSLVTQGSYQFYTLTMPSDVLARTCAVSTRQEDPQKGFQRALDERRAQEIAQYIDSGHSIPNSIVLSAQERANLKVIGRGKTLEFSDAPQIVARIEEFFRLLASSGPLSSGQLSETRNAISYRHELAVWFPFISSASKGRPVPKLELKGNENVRLDILPKHEPRDAFTNAAHYLACLNYDLAEMIVARSRSSDFGRTWARLKKDAGS